MVLFIFLSYVLLGHIIKWLYLFPSIFEKKDSQIPIIIVSRLGGNIGMKLPTPAFASPPYVSLFNNLSAIVFG